MTLVHNYQLERRLALHGRGGVSYTQAIRKVMTQKTSHSWTDRDGAGRSSTQYLHSLCRSNLQWKWRKCVRKVLYNERSPRTAHQLTKIFPTDKILQEEIKSTSIGPKNQDNLTNGAEYKSHDESHPTSDKNSAWKEIRCTRGTNTQNKGLEVHSHHHQTDTTLCVMFRKYTIPQ